MSDSPLRRDDVLPLLRSTFVQSVHYFAEVASTNDEAHRRAHDNEPLPALFIAAQQTAGRGRGTNRWITSAGALTFSLLADVSGFRSRQESWPQLSLWTGLGIRSGLANFVPDSDLQVKWPNDVYLQQKKVCGILIEGVVGAPHLFVIGIGINANNVFPPDSCDDELSQIAISLIDVCGKVQIVKVLQAVLLGIERAWHSFAEQRDVRDSWKPHCFLTGRPIQWQAGKSNEAGICRGIDEDGALLLELPREISATTTQRGFNTVKCYGGTVSLR